nr:unknown [Asclepias potyvirus A]
MALVQIGSFNINIAGNIIETVERQTLSVLQKQLVVTKTPEVLGKLYCKCPICDTPCPTKSFYRKHMATACDLMPVKSQLSEVGYVGPDIIHTYVDVPQAMDVDVHYQDVVFDDTTYELVGTESTVTTEVDEVSSKETMEASMVSEDQSQLMGSYKNALLLDCVVSKPTQPKAPTAHKPLGNSEYQEQMRKFDEQVKQLTYKKYAERAQLGTKQFKNGTSVYRRFNPHISRRKNLQIGRRAERLARFHEGPDHLVDKISIGGGPTPSAMEGNEHGQVHALSVKRERKKQPKKVVATESVMTSLLNAIGKLMKRNLTVEIIDKKRRQLKAVLFQKKKVLTARTAHQDRKTRLRDVPTSVFLENMTMALHRQFRELIVKPSTITYGMSGFILSTRHDKNVIVRGKLCGELIDARAELCSEEVKLIKQFSSTPELFWKGFDEEFRANRPTIKDHTCESNFDVERCGRVAAITCQTILPCGKITCSTCAQNLASLTFSEYKSLVQEKLIERGLSIRERFPEFTQVPELMMKMSKMEQFYNPNVQDSKEIVRIIGDRNDGPFHSVNCINKILSNGNTSSADQFSEMSKHLLDIARYLKNRTENIRNGSLSSFRNKFSAKSHINITLMCDNQRDKNGNFLWGERGYHARRFFSNYFEFVDPTDGYSRHVNRKSPNTVRKLAIGNLIIPTDLEKLRSQLEGAPIQRVPISKACVSMKDGHYKYPCCCVTLDDGSPLLSELYMPTKNHLVVGNTGDQKLVDLPKDIGTSMYIAKNGYCYLNIFLAMLVNVSEERAKDFTKRVRDLVVPTLGTWPSLMDLATMCYLLTALFPDTLTAELPRLLVDHKSQTIHVQDTYGSFTTGYHILKAQTVTQLMSFAHESLESEMKHYLVGGNPERIENPESNLKKLIKSIYRPKVMQELLVEDPYLMVLSIMSPGIVIAMHNSKAYEFAIKAWIDKDKDIASIATMMSVLAKKISMATLVKQQFEVIEQNVENIYSVVFNGFKTDATYMSVIQYLEVLRARNEMDGPLEVNGFKKLHSEMVHVIEKNYRDQLEESWRELSLWEKFSVIKQSYTFFKFSRSTLMPELINGSDGSQRKSLKVLLAEQYHDMKKNVSSIRSGLQNKFYCVLGKIAYYYMTACQRFLPDICKLLNIMMVCQILIYCGSEINRLFQEAKYYKQLKMDIKFKNDCKQLETLHKMMSLTGDITMEEFTEKVKETNPNLLYVLQDNEVEFQAKQSSDKIEKVVAFSALIMMFFDVERSDYLYRLMNKIRGLIGTCERVEFQSLDEIESIDLEKQLTVDIELNTNDKPEGFGGTTFSEWFTNQLNNNRTIPHYRTEGCFLEFSRATVSKVANEIAHSSMKDFLIRGAVGSGKSTALPMQLANKGRVLLLEPTRPLAENVARQLKGEPFFASPSLQMRGLSSFGSSPIEIMTSGFALHYLAHNTDHIQLYDFIIFDECHVNDASAIATRSLLHEYNFKGKILKVSATPPGRETEFTTQFKVDLRIEDDMSLSEFARVQGSGVQADMTAKCESILVYVASYNDVDTLAKALTGKGYMVSKVDGRTMKVGECKIPTKGTKERPHFIVATNIIENGVTLDIDGVVDFGLKVVPMLDMDTRRMSYIKTSVSLGERIQRLGRVGRFKEGYALRIGYTQKDPFDIPVSIATEAAFLCFCYGLPVMPQNVMTSAFKNCSLDQARVAAKFELPALYTQHFIRFDGHMHPEVHKILSRFKLRDSTINLSKSAIPGAVVKTWYSAKDYNKFGAQVSVDDNVRIPFLVKDIPDRVHEDLWKCIRQYHEDNGFGRMTGIQSCKIAYTLQTDLYSIPRTVKILDYLIECEQKKLNQFRSITSNNCSYLGFSLSSIGLAIKARYATNHTSENIDKLQRIKCQIQEFENANIDPSHTEALREFKGLECVEFQSADAMRKHLKLGGDWNLEKAFKDLLLLGGLTFGGLWLLFEFYRMKKEEVEFQGYNKRQRQKLKFRNARDSKVFREVYADDETMANTFGEAYTKKGRKSGKTKGLGHKRNKFFNMYGFDPTDFTTVRFVDPLTGAVLEESPYTDVMLVQDRLLDIRGKMHNEGLLETENLRHNQRFKAYLLNEQTKKAIEIDMTPHNPLQMSVRSTGISGFPERAGELRQTGEHKEVDYHTVPQVNDVEFEGMSLFKGVRNYNPIAAVVCALTNHSEGRTSKMFGIGFGPYIIANQHLFRLMNGELHVESLHGKYLVKNILQLPLKPLEGRDMIIIKMPKDFPPFPQRLKFRQPRVEERVCIVSSDFQTKSVSSLVSESSETYPTQDTHFWKHWIDTERGECGSPVVGIHDGAVVGIHSLRSRTSKHNFYTVMPGNIHDILKQDDGWQRNWKFNANNILWGELDLVSNTPASIFGTVKSLTPVMKEIVEEQAKITESRWLYNSIHDNIRPVSYLENNLVTKHVVKGKCKLFSIFLSSNPAANEFFTPLMGAYQPSRLNKEAYTKDLMKYSKVITVGEVDCRTFELTFKYLRKRFREWGFKNMVYITEPMDIINDLNLKAAVGALYRGKKRDYFADLREDEMAELVMASCKRLWKGQMGIWNGSLKAELRPIEKVEANKTRTFTAAPIDTLLGAKVCVDDFNKLFYSLNIVCPWSVGMTKFYRGWNDLYAKLPDNWIYCDADGSQFDSSLTPYLLNAVLRLRLFCMEEWDLGAQMLQNLYTEIVYTPIATPDGTIVKKFRGNNSGQPSTVVDNTIMVLLAMYYSLMKSGIPSDDFENVCVFFANGDDLILAIEPSHAHILSNFSEYFSQLGLNYDFSNVVTDKKELWFMSHKAIEKEGILIPKLEMERIVSILEWDRSEEPAHRLEAIVAAMIESWGYPELTHKIREFYAWVLEQMPYKELAAQGRAPYLAETALKRLYTDIEATEEELERYKYLIDDLGREEVEFQADDKQQKVQTLDAGESSSDKGKDKIIQAKDVDVGSQGTFSVPKIKKMSPKMNLPKVGGKKVVNLEHLLVYKPAQIDISNTRSTHDQFEAWVNALKKEYDLKESEIEIVLNGLMVWCIENGTSPNINGDWTMMEGETQITYPLKPVVENAAPTLRQIMAHFSDLAEAYITMRNNEEIYIPRYALKRNLTDRSLAKYAFDFYEITSKTPVRVREAHMQMKAAAVGNRQTRMFGLDGNVGTQEEDTERHTVNDVNKNMHTMMGVRNM